MDNLTNTQSPTAFDPTKPVQTRDGRKARILCADLAGPLPIAVAVEVRGSEQEVVGQRDAFGLYAGRNVHGADLVNVPEVTTKIANAYRNSVGRLWVDYPDNAKYDKGMDRYAGYVEWTFEDGEPVSCRFVKDNA